MIQIDDKSRCCGCEACRQVCPKGCIRLEVDKEGFRYPTVDLESCTHCDRCEAVCPFLQLDKPRRPERVYAAQTTDLELRLASSSGGLFTLLAEETIRQGGVVFGARFDESWSVRHDYTEEREGLAPFRGSKYLQSCIGDCYQRAELFLKEGRQVLFSGTPCQVKGLVNYLGRSYDNLTTIDVVCHGVPSPMVWQAYLATQLQDVDDAARYTVISFRNKERSGWRRYELHAKLTSGTRETNWWQYYGDNLYMRGFLQDLYLRPSCYHCMAKGGRSHSDLTLGDYWGIEQVCPELDDDKGTSVLLIYSDRGRALFERISCQYKATSYESVLSGNPSIERSVSEPPRRHTFFEQVGQEPLGKLLRRLTAIPLHKRLWCTLHHRAHQIKRRLFNG